MVAKFKLVVSVFFAFPIFANTLLVELKIQPPVLSFPENFVVHTQPESLLAFQTNWKPDPSLLLQLTIVTDLNYTSINDADGFSLHRNGLGFSRFSTLYNVIALPSFPHSVTSYLSELIMHLAYYSTTMILIFKYQTIDLNMWGIHEHLEKFPCLQVVLTISSHTNKIRKASIHCNNYCDKWSAITKPVILDLHTTLRRPTKSHKLFYRVGSGGLIPAYIDGICTELIIRKIRLQSVSISSLTKSLISSDMEYPCLG